ncbi:probable thioredoxin at N-terminal half [Coccomyxa sp. Obi]|nr:probable thioredoxin at N-terminal half [Coccomyxa sp. Obi]
MQRSRIRRSQGVKKLRGRVVSIKDVAQWQKLLNKIGEKLLVAHFFAPWSAPCKQMRSFLNDISSRPAYSHVVFAELDVDSDGINGIAEEEDVAALPTIQYWKGGKCVDMAKGGAAMAVLEKLQKHAGPRPQGADDKKSLRDTIVKCVGAGVALLAAGFLGYRMLGRRVDEETRVLRELERLNKRIKELRKAPIKRRRKSRRGKARMDPLTSAEEADLFSRQQALTIKLQQLRSNKAGVSVEHFADELSEEEEDPYISDDEE